MSGYISIIGTPIGNLSDASPRVKQTLAAAQLLLCEDTRVTSKLLSAFSIHVPLMRCDEHTIAARTDEVLQRVFAGEHVCFVSDAGMPAISDPGQVLVDAALDAGVHIEVIPGPSAVVCALAASGLNSSSFFFEGFLPRKQSAIDRRVRVLSTIPATCIIYESPHRVCATLHALAAVMPTRRVALVRELTKVHEEVQRAHACELAEIMAKRCATAPLKGECVIVVECDEATSRELSCARIDATAAGAGAGEKPTLEDAIHAGIAEHIRPTQLAKELASTYNMPRAQVYDAIVAALEAATE